MIEQGRRIAEQLGVEAAATQKPVHAGTHGRIVINDKDGLSQGQGKLPFVKSMKSGGGYETSTLKASHSERTICALLHTAGPTLSTRLRIVLWCRFVWWDRTWPTRQLILVRIKHSKPLRDRNEFRK